MKQQLPLGIRWQTPGMRWTLQLPQIIALKKFPGQGAGGGSQEQPGRNLSWDRATSLRRPKQLEFTGKSTREERTVQENNSRELQGVSLKYSVEYQ